MSKGTPKKPPITRKNFSRSTDKKPVVKSFITWFEIPAVNFVRARDFYNYIYQIDMETSELQGHTMAFFPNSEGIGGALICGEGSTPSDKGPLIYLNAGNDIDGIIQRINEAGGSLLMEKTFINDTAGYFALFMDTEGNKLALHSNSNL